MSHERKHYHGHRERLRRRLMDEPRALADYEVLELLLAQTLPRADTKPLAKELLLVFGGLRGVLEAPEAELVRVPGFGPALAHAWRLMAELRARLAEEPLRRRETLSSPDVVAEGAKARFGSRRTEEFWAALVDNKNRVLSWERISSGITDQTAVFPRQVLALAIEREASGVILVHNHPGGDPAPSREDRLLTQRIAAAARELDVRVLDHLIVTADSYYSFQEHGLL